MYLLEFWERHSGLALVDIDVDNSLQKVSLFNKKYVSLPIFQYCIFMLLLAKSPLISMATLPSSLHHTT